MSRARSTAPALSVSLAFAASLFIVTPALGQTSVSNDDLVSLSELEPVLLGTGDLAASVFYPDESLFPFRLLGVEVLWASEAGGAAPVIATALHVMSGNTETTFEIVDSIPSPVLNDGEFNLVDLESLDLYYSEGPIAIGLELGEDALAGDPGVAMDSSGCLNDRNFIYDPIDGWYEGCFLGMTGDFVIRLLVEPLGDEFHARRGTVHMGEDSVPAVVLTVNGSHGDDLYREVSVEPDTLFEVEIVKPPMGGSGLYAFWLFEGAPSEETVTPAVIKNGIAEPIELGLAPFCLPTNNTVAAESCPCPLAFPIGFTSIALRDSSKADNLCLHTLPRDPFPPASFFLSLPEGEYTLAGIILDPASPTPGLGKNVSLMNSIVIVVE